MRYPILQFRSRSIIEYNGYLSEGRFIRTQRQRQSAERFADKDQTKTYTGTLCPGARKRLTKALELLIQYAKPQTVKHEGREVKFSVNFITLTIHNPGVFVSGAQGHSLLLEPFLKWIRDNHISNLADDNPFMYLWKAELQGKRSDVNQLHYHLTTNCYIHKDAIRDKWNELQIRAGFLDMQAYKAKFGHDFVPATKVHALYKKRDPVAYIKKEIMNYSDFVDYAKQRALNDKMSITAGPIEKNVYNDIVAEISKDIQNTYTIGGKVWDCSANLRGASYHTEDLLPSADTDQIWQNLEKAKQAGEVRSTATEQCTIHHFKRGHTWSILPKKQRMDYWRKAIELKDYKRKPPEKPIVHEVKEFTRNFYEPPPEKQLNLFAWGTS